MRGQKLCCVQSMIENVDIYVMIMSCKALAVQPFLEHAVVCSARAMVGSNYILINPKGM